MCGLTYYYFDQSTVKWLTQRTSLTAILKMNSNLFIAQFVEQENVVIEVAIMVCICHGIIRSNFNFIRRTSVI